MLKDKTFILVAHFLYSTYTTSSFLFRSKDQENFAKCLRAVHIGLQKCPLYPRSTGVWMNDPNLLYL